MVKLAFCLVDGTLKPVADYAQTTRPAHAQCPSCREPVTLRLGAKVTPHAAHKPASTCTTTRGESALHWNVKLHIWEHCRNGGSGLLFRGPCPRCSAPWSRHWPGTWTHATYETPYQGFRLDVALWAGRNPVAALEICASSPVDLAKADALDVPWFEIRASPEIYSNIPGYSSTWRQGQALPLWRASDPKINVCALCRPR